ncbi:leucyl aminopeptidase family protein [Pseudomarimonas salicorniae]|uniref:Leucyl aminopeptidase family protein n=1 Tax=Pseudomarimonas salicorniae TaxID=2933270 RepID=A0ABT0GLT6_9GAMM|nr:leucyl aminopeptidase family protein [Lysobacter sp. CAU 1642]MCK7595508.1 leucyl aminopeptidase family protein [Lysobacter sp. CAU 1642]
MSLPTCFAPPDAAAHATPLVAVDREGLPALLASLPSSAARWCQSSGFAADPHSVLLVPDADGRPLLALAGIAGVRDPLALGAAPLLLPAGDYRLDGERGLRLDPGTALLGWGLGAYQFTRYRQPTRTPARLVLGEDASSQSEAFAQLKASTLVRDLINTPTEDMGPDELEAVARRVGLAYGGEVRCVRGDQLLAENFPAIHAVGRASHREPRLIEVLWGNPEHPRLSIVGKGVCFDTGGLDIKPADGMRNMKKDMGGAAHAIGLAQLVMARKLPVRLQLLVGAVENAISANAYRPGEVLRTRAGISIEVDNTDAEGRIVLCDALTYAAESKPALLLDYATLTGAARIALGPDLPALFCNDETLAAEYLRAGEESADPLWRLPLWRPYLSYLASNVADLANSGGSRMAGAITAAVYLDRFVPRELPWAHIDVYSWNDSHRPGRPPGGEAQGLRAAFALLKARFAA